ncbi:hypothetical protein EDC18_101498 [Natranaerovirga pectinivora]|uniref:Uncharacterized protein n=1 Tax=Natranaerovirga pectinivora TaxID=682400 RepID=A0A4R3MTZ9_9FIRM|nr:hypothetical protein [Natranaerovirga pectinivora]TCT17200.1 hypothetical protein EDC18_101498 [Natranaerovirga pectinivora]
MTNLKVEVKKSWEVFINNFIKFMFLITLLFIIGQGNDFMKSNHISRILSMLILPLTIFIQLMVVHIVISSENSNFNDLIRKSFKEYKEVFIIVGLQLLILAATIFTIIPIIPMLIIQCLFIFVWPIFVVEKKTRFEAILASLQLVSKNIKDLFKYLVLYIIIILVIAFILTLTNGLQMNTVENVVIVSVKYFERFVTLFFTLMFTRLYLLYRNRRESTKVE